MNRVWTALFFFCFLAAASAQSTVFDRLSERLATAKQQGKPVLLFLTSEDGVLPKKFEAEVFSDPGVGAALSSYVVARINADGAEGAQVRTDYGWRRPPLLAILNSQGEHFDVLDLASVSESLINANLATEVSTWLEKGIARFHSHGPLGYIQSPVLPGDPIIKLIADSQKNPDLPDTASACLLDEGRVDVREDGGCRSHFHQVWVFHAGSAYPTPGSTFTIYRSVLETGWKLIRARTLVPILGRQDEYMQNAVDPGEVQESPAYPDYPSLDKLQVERIVLPGVHDGSVIEVEWETEIDPQMPGHFNYTWLVDRSNFLILDSRLRIEAPSDLGIDYRSVRLSPPVKEETRGGNTVFTWNGRSEHAHPRKSGAAATQESPSYLVFASRTTWQEIGDWFLSLADQGRQHNSALDAWIDDATRGVSKDGADYPRRVVTALQKALHRDIRYLAVNLSESGYQPHPVLETFRNKYGDCKDLALFLQECLRRVGVESDLVLLRANDREDLQKQIPHAAFTHAILRVRDGDHPFFADGTADMPGGLIPTMDQGVMGLVCVDKKSELVPIDTADAAQEGRRATLSFHHILNDPVRVDVDLVVQGLGGTVHGLNEEAAKELGKRLLDEGLKDVIVTGAKIRQGNEDKPFDFSVEATTRDVVTSTGDLVLLPALFFTKGFFSAGLPVPQSDGTCAFNSGQFVLPITQVINYDIPPGMSLGELPKPLHLDNPYFTLDRTVEPGNGTLKITTSLVHKVVRETPRMVTEKELGPEAQGLQEKLTQPILLRRSSGRALFDAARKGDLAQVTALVDQGADLEQGDEEGKTPLMVAAMEGNSDIVSYLIGKGAKLEAQTRYQATALSHACWKNRGKAAMLLIEAGADCNVQGRDGSTPLIYAASAGNEEIAAALLSHHADINADSPDGPALTWAIYKNQPLMVAFLLDHGADPSLASTPAKGNSVTPLGQAALSGRAEILETLLKRGADVNGAGPDGETPLMWAARFNKVDSIEALLAHGAKIDLQDQDGNTALFQAVHGRYKEAAATLLKHKADPNIKNFAGRTALMQACYEETNQEMAHLLVESGADLNVKDAQGNTALIYAGNCGNADLVAYLKGKGAADEPLHIIPLAVRKDPLPPAQAWALGTCAIFIQQRGLDHQFLGGHEERSPEDMRAELRKTWHINGKQDLLDALVDLDHGNLRTRVQERAAALARMSDAEFDVYLHGPSVTEKQVEYFKLLRPIYQHWQDRTALAYDLCRHTYLAGEGFNAGYLSEDEAWKLIMPVAREIQAHFTSWQEMGQNYLDGRAVMFTGKPDPRFEACYQLLLNPNDPNSPWRLPWKTDLGATASIPSGTPSGSP